jgi:squalene-associated FAD-dependent desaturase
MAETLNTRVAIIGAGCAGLAAAAKLSEKNIPVTLFEAAPQLGGRARKVSYQGLSIDNGQHILLGAYQETLQLLKLVGVDFKRTLQRLPLTMHMQDAHKHSQLRLKTCQYLPAPLHLLVGLIISKGLSAKDKWLAIRMMTLLQINCFKLNQDIDLYALLTKHKQSANLIQNLWEPLCLAALNTPIRRASSQVFLNVLRDSFARKKSDSDMLLAKLDLTSLIGEPIRRYIQSNNGEVCHATIDKIAITNHGYTLSSSIGERSFSHVVLAVAPHQLDKIAPNTLVGDVLGDKVQAFSYQPITTLYLQFSTDTRLPLVMQGLVNSISQWVFDRGQICDQHGLIAVVISAHGQHSGMTQTKLAEAVIKEITLAFKLDKPLWFKMITEKRATFSCDVGIKRPTNTTISPNLYLAGDYTEGDYPATIEGAVRSGLKCASLISNQLQSLQP